MDPQKEQAELNEQIRERFKALPEVVQRAITSTDVQKQLRQLADTEKLHIDQWQLLENNVMLTLLGFQPPEELARNLKSDLDVNEEIAKTLAGDISRIVFEPIRKELERELEHPEAQEKQVSGIETARTDALSKEHVSSRTVQTESTAKAPDATPPAPPPAPPEQAEQDAPTSASSAPPAPEKVARRPASGAYKPGETSIERKNVHDDPYRELPE